MMKETGAPQVGIRPAAGGVSQRFQGGLESPLEKWAVVQRPFPIASMFWVHIGAHSKASFRTGLLWLMVNLFILAYGSQHCVNLCGIFNLVNGVIVW
jgi:hypothetical protein